MLGTIKPRVIEEIQIDKKIKTIFNIDKSFNVFCITDTKLSISEKKTLLKTACLCVGRFERISDSNKYVCEILSENKCKELIIEKNSDCDLDFSFTMHGHFSWYIKNRPNTIAYQVWEYLINGIDIENFSVVRLEFFNTSIEVFIDRYYPNEFPEEIYRLKIVTMLVIQKQLIKR